jgi:hypothetical protein
MRGGVDREEGAGTARGSGPGGGADEGEAAALARKRESMWQRRHRIWLRGGWGMKVGRRVCWEKNGEFLAKWFPHHLNPDGGSTIF